MARSDRESWSPDGDEVTLDGSCNGSGAAWLLVGPVRGAVFEG